MFRQTDHPDDEIKFDGRPEYPVATLEDGSRRVQIIPEGGAWTPVILESGKYRLLLEVESTDAIRASIAWAYQFTLGIGGVPEDAVGIEGPEAGEQA